MSGRATNYTQTERKLNYLRYAFVYLNLSVSLLSFYVDADYCFEITIIIIIL